MAGSTEQPLKGTAAQARRRALTEAAFDLIAERGVGGLRIRDVAAQVGVNNATLHYYFPTKEQLIAAVIEFVGHEFVTAHAPDYDPKVDDRSARSRLHRYFRDLAYQIETSPKRFLVVSELFLEQQRQRIFQQEYHNDIEWQTYLTAMLQEGVVAGEFRADLDLLPTVNTIIAFCKGLPLTATTTAQLEQTVAAFEHALLGAMTVT